MLCWCLCGLSGAASGACPCLPSCLLCFCGCLACRCFCACSWSLPCLPCFCFCSCLCVHRCCAPAAVSALACGGVPASRPRGGFVISMGTSASVVDGCDEEDALMRAFEAACRAEAEKMGADAVQMPGETASGEGGVVAEVLKVPAGRASPAGAAAPAASDGGCAGARATGGAAPVTPSGGGEGSKGEGAAAGKVPERCRSGDTSSMPALAPCRPGSESARCEGAYPAVGEGPAPPEEAACAAANAGNGDLSAGADDAEVAGVAREATGGGAG